MAGVGTYAHCALVAFYCLVCTPAARAQSVPDTAKPPAGGDYGSSSFYDGFGRVTPGISLLEYGTFTGIDSITGPEGSQVTVPGKALRVFQKPSIHAVSVLTQLSFTTGWHPFGGDAVGFVLAMPVVDLSAHFGAGSRRDLQANGLGNGDLTWGPTYQSKYDRAPSGRPVFAYRLQFTTISPVGAFNKDRNINQSCGYWAIDPNISVTYVPIPKLEFSGRLTYQYNFQTSKLAAAPRYRNGQAGAMIYDNFDASYKITKHAELGFNGFFIDELNPDRTDGRTVPHSRESEVFVGPGARYTFNATNALNVNFYLPVEAHNESVGPKFNMQYIHRF